MKKELLFLLLFTTVFNIYSQSKSKLWTIDYSVDESMVKSSKKMNSGNLLFDLNLEDLNSKLENVLTRQSNNISNVILEFPDSEGNFERFFIYEASTMHPSLQSRYPEIRSYVGKGIDNQSAIIRFSISPLGFQSMRTSASSSAVFIESLTVDGSKYEVFTRNDLINEDDEFECQVVDEIHETIQNGANQRNANDAILRTYDLAVSTTGEYTQYHGGTKALALAAINATMTRVNGIFENDFNVTMQLIANTDDVIYTNGSSDPYSSSNYNNQLQSTLNSVIGSANYDIGHLFAQGSNNGNAGCIGCVCVTNQKGSGFTSHVIPEGDNFDVDYVAHEMGHQFGANHTWTFNGNEGTNVQMEPGSGSTIMGYAGITGATDVQAHSDPYFHAISIEQVTDYVQNYTSCQVNTSTGNAVPVVNAGSNYTIPKGTPFILEGTGTDSDSGDILTYCWEQMDENNASSTYPSTTATSGVSFRSYSPSLQNHRYFPRLETIKTGATSWQWEAIPNVARTLNFRLTVRDNQISGGNNESDDMIVTVNGTAGPFIVTTPNTNVSWNVGSTQTVTWNVAGTTGNGINATNVDIYLSIDGGDTYPILLASGVSNDGSQDITVPDNDGVQNRIMVRGSNNIFFDISDADFTIVGPCVASVPDNLAVSSLGANTATIDWDSSSAQATYDLQYRETGSVSWITISDISAISYDLSGLSPSTEYDVQIRSKCPDNSTSDYSDIFTFITTQVTYCDSQSSNYSDEYISNVQLNTINNSSGGSFYTDFTSISTDLIVDNAYTITITPTWTGTVYQEGYSVWIDYNQNGDFTDSGEQVFTQSATTSTPISSSFTVPSTASLGATRMRVSLKYNGIPSSCEAFTWGEVEDYTVNITPPMLIYSAGSWSPYGPSSSTGAENAMVLDGSFTMSGDIELNDLTINSSASLVLNPSSSLVVNGILTTNDNLILLSDTDEYSSLISSNEVIGSVTYNRHVNINESTGGNDLISAPVTGQTFGDFASLNSNIYSNPLNPSQKLFGPFDKASGAYITFDTDVAADNLLTLDPAIGYRAASTDNGSFIFSGLVNINSVLTNIEYSGPYYVAWNLIGNPYPSYLSLQEFLNINSSQLNSESIAIYGYDGDASNGWTIWNQAYSDANPNSKIAPGQGFLVASVSTGGTITFNPNMRMTGNSDDFIIGRTSNNPIYHLELQADKSNSSYKTNFYFTDNATLGLDPGYDASLLDGNAPNFAIYSHLIEDNIGVDMGIQSLGIVDLSEVSIPIGINVEQGQQVTVSISNSTLEEGTNVFLEDNYTGEFTLLNEQDYMFTANSTLNDTGRFFLRFSQSTLSNDTFDLDSIDVYMSNQTNSLYIKGNLEEKSVLKLMDAQGRVVLSTILNEGQLEHVTSLSYMSTGLYIVELSNSKQRITKKIVKN